MLEVTKIYKSSSVFSVRDILIDLISKQNELLPAVNVKKGNENIKASQDSTIK